MDNNIIVIGGGPSGLSTALHLASLAPDLIQRILVLEKAFYPRTKLCGGGLVADAEMILQLLGLDVHEVPHVDASAAHFDFAGKGLTMRMPRGHIIRFVRRDEFDAWLAKKTKDTGIRIREGVTVKNVRPQDDCVIVETDSGTYTAQVVVGADGSNGVTRQCAMPDAPAHKARVLEVLTPYVWKGDTISPHQPDHAYFDFFPIATGIAGYTWDFPTQVKGQQMRCWGIYDTNLLIGQERPKLKELLAKEMSREGLDLYEYEIKGHPIRWFRPFDRLSVPRVILAGDAAGVDGIFGEGISMALGYGALAAKAVYAAFAKDDFSFHDYRRRILISPLGQTLTIRWAITQILYHMHWAWFQKIFWRVFKPIVAVGSQMFVLNWGRRMR